MSTRTRRSSTRPAPASDAAAAASNAASSASATPATAAPTASSSSTPAAPTFNLSTKKLKQLKSAYESLLDSSLAPTSSSDALLASLPRELHAKHALVIQRQTEKVLTSVRKNCLNEFEVILSEHRLPEKLGEIELLETSADLNGGVALGGTSFEDGPTPTPEQVVKNMIRKAKNDEKARLQQLAEELESENLQLRTEIEQVSESLKNPRLAVERKQEAVEQLYQTLEKESRQATRS